ncbi:TPA: DUF551 domain-containing protein [Yersinia enterocolitica]
MKELDGFTVEQLNDFIKSDHAQCGDVAALARIALAAKRAEPIYQYQSGVCTFDDIEWVWYDCDKGFYEQYDSTRRRIVYTTPQLNSPEIPEGWIKCSDQMPEDCQTVLCNNMLTELSGIPFIADYVGMFDLHDGTRYEAGFYVNRTPQTVTNWMPLPAAPESE